MTTFAILAAFYFALALLAAPLRLYVAGHISLDSMQVDVRIFGLSPLRLRARLSDDKIKIELNGKPKRLKGNIDIKTAVRLIGKYYKRLVSRGSISVMIGFVDARDTAIAVGLMNILLSPLRLDGRVYSAGEERLEIDGGLKIRLSILTAIGIAIKAKFSLHKGESMELDEMLKNAIENIKSAVESDKIIGKPVTIADGSVILPISRLSYGFIVGGGEYGKAATGSYPYAGASGGGVTVTPLGFLICGLDKRFVRVDESKGGWTELIKAAIKSAKE